MTPAQSAPAGDPEFVPVEVGATLYAVAERGTDGFKIVERQVVAVRPKTLLADPPEQWTKKPVRLDRLPVSEDRPGAVAARSGLYGTTYYRTPAHAADALVRRREVEVEHLRAGLARAERLAEEARAFAGGLA